MSHGNAPTRLGVNRPRRQDGGSRIIPVEEAEHGTKDLLRDHGYDKKPVWECCECKQHSGMTSFIVQCPGCSHLHCGQCNSYFVRSKDSGRYCYTKWREPSKPTSSGLAQEDLVPTPVVSVSLQISNSLSQLHQSRGALPIEHGKTQAPMTSETQTSIDPAKLVLTAPSQVFSHLGQQYDSLATPTSPESPMSPSQSSECSQTASDIFSARQRSVESPSSVESMSGESGSEEEDEPYYPDQLSTLNQSFRALETILMSLLRDNLSLAVAMLPRAQALIQLGVTHPDSSNGSDIFGYRPVAEAMDVFPIPRSHVQYTTFGTGWQDVPSHTRASGKTTEQGSNSTQDTVSNGSQTSKGDNHGSPSKRQKRGRTPDDPERPGGLPQAKKSKYGPETGSRTFACPFHKDNPQKYHPSKDRKYRGCLGPSVPEDRVDRIKYHFKTAHSNPQCNRCYLSFSNSGLLVAHQEQEVPCEKGHRSLKEGIDLDQWERIERVLKDRGKYEFQKWYEIWDILLPGVAHPSSPWNEPQGESSSHIPNLQTFTSSLEFIVESTIPRELAQQNPSVIPSFIRDIRQAFVEATTSRSRAIQPRTRPGPNPVLEPGTEGVPNIESVQGIWRHGNVIGNQLAEYHSSGQNRFAAAASKDFVLCHQTETFLMPDMATENPTRASSSALNREFLCSTVDLQTITPQDTLYSQSILNSSGDLSNELPQLEGNVTASWFNMGNGMHANTNVDIPGELLEPDLAGSENMGVFSGLDLVEQGVFPVMDNHSFTEMFALDLYPGSEERHLTNEERNQGPNYRPFGT